MSKSAKIVDECLLTNVKYFAARRNIVRMHNMIRTKSKAVGNMNMWELTGNASGMMEMANKQPPFSLDEEVVGIIGHGRIGTWQSFLRRRAKLIVGGRQTT